MNKKMSKLDREEESLKRNKCSFCHKVVRSLRKEFKNERAKREFKTSGMCQLCQDKMFNDNDLDIL